MTPAKQRAQQMAAVRMVSAASKRTGSVRALNQLYLLWPNMKDIIGRSACLVGEEIILPGEQRPLLDKLLLNVRLQVFNTCEAGAADGTPKGESLDLTIYRVAVQSMIATLLALNDHSVVAAARRWPWHKTFFAEWRQTHAGPLTLQRLTQAQRTFEDPLDAQAVLLDRVMGDIDLEIYAPEVYVAPAPPRDAGGAQYRRSTDPKGDEQRSIVTAQDMRPARI